MTLLTILLQQQGQGAGWSSIIMMVALVAIFYFFMIRPQTKRQKEIADNVRIRIDKSSIYATAADSTTTNQA